MCNDVSTITEYFHYPKNPISHLLILSQTQSLSSTDFFFTISIAAQNVTQLESYSM